MEDKKIDRRSFLEKTGFYSFWLTIVASVTGMLRYFLPEVFDEPSMSFRLGKSEDFSNEEAILLEDKNLFVIKDSEGLYVISAVCTHLGCIVARTDIGYACPCHGSKFDLKGNVVGGPAPRSLSWFKVYRSAEGYLMVDTSKSVKIGEKLKI